MAKTKRVQVLMEPSEFKVLEGIARARGSSVGDLMREAVRIQHLLAMERERSSAAAQRFLRLPDIQLPGWGDLKSEIEDRHGIPVH